MASQPQATPPRILSFLDWAVASYQASSSVFSDSSIDEDQINRMMLQHVERYATYLANMGAETERTEFQALCDTVRTRPNRFELPTQQRSQNNFVLLFNVEDELNWNYAICFRSYTAVMSTAHSQTWPASMALREARIEADRRELYGLSREWDAIDGMDHQNPRTLRLLLELLISEAERSCSEQVQLAVLRICRPQRRVLRTAIATESRLTEEQSNTTTRVLDQASRLIDEYRQDGNPQIPVERDPPLEAWECRALSTRAEREWQEENERNMTQQEWLGELKDRLVQQIEEDDMSGDELEDENSQIRNLYHDWNYDVTRPGDFSDHSRRARIDHNDHDPIVEIEMEDVDESEYQDVRDESGSDRSDGSNDSDYSDSDDSESSESTDNSDDSDDSDDSNDPDDSDDANDSESSGSTNNSDNSYSSQFCINGVRGCDCDRYW